MKRIIGIALAAGLAAGLIAMPAAAQRQPDTLGRIKAAKRINVAISGDSLPFSYIETNNEPSGYSIDLCTKVVAQVARTTGVSDLKVRWLVGTAAERVQMIASGKADIDCANTTATQTRMKSVDFSNLIFVETGGFLVNTSTGAQKFSDLGGKRIGVIAGTTTETRLTQALKDNLVNANITRVRDGNEGLAMLESGLLDAFASDKVKLVGLASQSKDPSKITLLGEDLSYEPLAFAVPRGDSNFRLEVNKALTQVYTGRDFDAIFGRWFGPLGKPAPLLAAVYILSSIPE